MRTFASALSAAVFVGLIAAPSFAKADTFISFVSNDGRSRYHEDRFDHRTRRHGYVRVRDHHHRRYAPPPVQYVYQPIMPTYRTQVVYSPSPIITARDSVYGRDVFSYR
ncbi:MAG: hypothetical protein PHD48_00420 [Alphaproteobacteria bacterium]|nr:hypothetical protein [Alphaproteobacteria bacterium]